MNAAPLRLLLVEDLQTQALRLDRLLESHGFEVVRVSSGETAMNSLKAYIPDLVITDYHLPGMNGGRLARQFRINTVTRAVPILMLTDGAEPAIERAGLENGVDGYISKHADDALLVFRIRALLREYPLSGRPPVGEMFRRARIGVVTRPGGALARWGIQSRLLESPQVGAPSRRDEEVTAQRGLRVPLVDLLRGDGHDAVLLPDPANPEPGFSVGLEPAGLDQSAHSLSSPQGIDRCAELFDCVVLDLTVLDLDMLAICRGFDASRRRVLPGEPAPVRVMGFAWPSQMRGEGGISSYGAGLDEVISPEIDPDILLLRFRALLRRKFFQDESRRSEIERLAREGAIEGAKAKAALADALEAANVELANANRKLIEAQSRLVQSAKMASLGELVAGIAHEFNNPLAFVSAHEETVSRLLLQAIAALGEGRSVEAQNILEKCRERLVSTGVGLGRMRDLVVSLRKFSRLDEGGFDAVDVPESINTVVSLLGPKLGERIAVKCDFAAPRLLRCQAALINQVVMNLVSNAADALAEKENGQNAAEAGRQQAAARRPVITIATRLAQLGGVEGEAEREGYLIEVRDTGTGIPEGLRERVFEPFFTTKPVGAGTGLGLATAYGVVQAHGGTITVGDAEGGGACLTIAVPYNRVVDGPVPAKRLAHV